MRIATGNLWERTGEADVLVVTTNAFIKKNGELVMGRGLALEVKERYPFVPKLLGRAILKKPDPQRYGFVLVNDSRLPFRLGAFQVKYHFKEPARMGLIRYSTSLLKDYAEQNPDLTIFLNFPGIGYGWLAGREREILRVIEPLPDNVIVWKFS